MNADTLIGECRLGTVAEVEGMPLWELIDAAEYGLWVGALHWVRGENRLVLLPRGANGEVLH